jgi:cytochrome P450
MNAIASLPGVDRAGTALSLFHLLDPEVLANPYPLYRRLRAEAPVHWDPFLHAWVVTRYADVVRVLHDFSADRTPTPEQLERMNLSAISPIAGHGKADAFPGRACPHASALTCIQRLHAGAGPGPAIAHSADRGHFD